MGFWRNLINRIRGIREIPEKIIKPTDTISKYNVDSGSLQDGKTNKDLELEKAVSYAKQGQNITSMQFNELTPTEIQSAYQLGYDLNNESITDEQIKYVGGLGAVIEAMKIKAEQAAKDNEYSITEAHRFVESGANTVLQMIEEKTTQEYRNAEIKKAVSYAKQGQNITSMQFDLLTSTEIQSAYQLGYDLSNESITEKQIEYVGGLGTVIDAMRVKAEQAAKHNGFSIDEADRFVESGADTVLGIIEEKSIEELNR